MDHEPVALEVGDHLARAVRQHVAELNRRFFNLSTGLDTIDAMMAEVINNHLAEIGLGSISDTGKNDR